jgi:mannose-6-phosphate isomerase-like protein (cupin superfamily)
MTKPILFDPSSHTIGLSRGFAASRMPERPDPPVPFSGLTFGVASMSENSPHGGEMHPDGDEVLYLISGRVKVVLLDNEEDDIEMTPGDGLLVPKGTWHRVDIIEPSQIVYLTPGPNNQFRPVGGRPRDS